MAIIKRPAKKLAIFIASVIALLAAIVVRLAGTDNLSEFGKIAKDLRFVETKTSEIVAMTGVMHLAHGDSGGSGEQGITRLTISVDVPLAIIRNLATEVDFMLLSVWLLVCGKDFLEQKYR